MSKKYYQNIIFKKPVSNYQLYFDCRGYDLNVSICVTLITGFVKEKTAILPFLPIDKSVFWLENGFKPHTLH